MCMYALCQFMHKQLRTREELGNVEDKMCGNDKVVVHHQPMHNCVSLIKNLEFCFHATRFCLVRKVLEKKMLLKK